MISLVYVHLILYVINMKFGSISFGQGYVCQPKKILWHKRAHRIFNDIGYSVIFYRRL